MEIAPTPTFARPVILQLHAGFRKFLNSARAAGARGVFIIYYHWLRSVKAKLFQKNGAEPHIFDFIFVNFAISPKL